MTRPLKPAGQFRQGEQVGLPLLSPAHGPEDAQQVGAVVNLPDQLVAAQLPRPKAQLVQLRQEGPAVLAAVGGQGGVKVGVRAARPQFRQPVGGEAVHGGAEHRDQGHVLPGIVHDLQQGQGHRDLGGAEEVPAPVRLPGDIPLPQGPGVVVEHRARGAEEDHDVGGTDGPLASLPVGHGEAPVDQFPDAFGGKAGLHQIAGGLLPVADVLRRGVQGVQLHRVAAVGLVRRAGVQGLVVGVVHLAEGGGHEVAEQEVGPLQHLGPGAEVFGQNQPPGLPLRRAGVVRPGPVLAQEDGGVGQAEAVDGLLHVPHQKEVGAVPGQGGKDGVLYLVGVLILVHHDLIVPGRPLAGQIGGGTVLPHQQPHRHVLQIGKVHHTPAGLLGGVGRLEVLHQGEQPPHRRVDRPEILQQIRPAVLEPAGELVHPLLAGGAEALNLLRGGGVLRQLLPPRRGEGDGQGGPGRVPALRRPLDEGVQPRQGGGQAGAVIGVQVGVAGAELQRLRDLAPPIAPLPGRVIQQQAAPGGVRRVGCVLQCKGFFLFSQPGGGVGVGLHPAPDVQDDLHQPGVVPPGGHGVHQLGKVAARHDVLIAPLQHVVEGAEHEYARLPLVTQAEVRV